MLLFSIWFQGYDLHECVELWWAVQCLVLRFNGCLWGSCNFLTFLVFLKQFMVKSFSKFLPWTHWEVFIFCGIVSYMNSPRLCLLIVRNVLESFPFKMLGVWANSEKIHHYLDLLDIGFLMKIYSRVRCYDVRCFDD